MKLVALLALILLPLVSFSQNENPNYNAEKAKEYGGDAYGMKSYFFIVLKSGENQSTDKAYRDSAFVGHMANINRLVEEGIMIVAGPFGKNDDDFRGLFILDVATIEEAQALMSTDTAIAEGFLKAYYYSWYGSAALPAYLPVADEIWEKQP